MIDPTLPKIAYYESIQDYGEYGAAHCPHCGAKGRYVHLFVTVDGQRLGAMSGCVKKYPAHRFALEHERILDKKVKGKNLTSWDEEILQAIEAFARGDIDERVADSRIKLEKRKRQQWMKRRRW
jgi:hypothetical protein